MSNFQKLTFVVLLFIGFSCANIVSPTGGEKDTTPPDPGKIRPENFSTNFSAKKIIISFDEYVVLKDPAAQIVISPPMEELPDFRLKGKNLIINLKSSLDSNTTYTINFGEAIQDLNEANILNNFQYVFSTGNYLDSLFITGSLIQAADNKPAENILLMIYNQLDDSIPYQKKPYYFTKTLKDGSFRINNIKAGDYKLFALKDVNFNFLYDVEQEQIGFYPEKFSIKADTVLDFNLELFQEDNVALNFFDYAIPQAGLIQFRYSRPVEHLKIQLLEPTENYPDAFFEYGVSKDTIRYWFTYNLAETQQLLLIANDTLVDTLNIENKLLTRDSLLTLSGLKPTFFGQGGSTISLDIQKPIVVNFNRPVKSFIQDSILLLEDTTLVRVYPEIKFSSPANRFLEIKYSWKENTRYELQIPDSVFFDYYGLTNDSISAIFLSKSLSDYGQLILSVKIDSALTEQRIIQLLDNNSKVLHEKIISSPGIYKMEYGNLLPGTYSLKTILDENKNGKWDTGNYLKKIQPEKIYLYPDKINLRANWESEIELNVK